VVWKCWCVREELEIQEEREGMFSLLALESYPLLQPLLFFRDWRDDNVTIEKKIIFVKNYHLFNLKKRKYRLLFVSCFFALSWFVLVLRPCPREKERKRRKRRAFVICDGDEEKKRRRF